MIPTMLYPISLADIRPHSPCKDGWDKLIAGLGDPPRSAWPTTCVTLGDVAAINGAADAWWCAGCLPADARRDVVRALLPCVRRAAAYSTDPRVHACIAALTRWVDGAATDDDVIAAARGARTAARGAWTAGREARAAAWAAEAAAEAARSVAITRPARPEPVARAARAAWAAAEEGARAKELSLQVADIITVFGRCKEAAAA